jgi:hypothetical protein
MQLTQFIERVRGIDLGAAGNVPPRENVLQLQSLLTEALTHEVFAIDCAIRQLDLIEAGRIADPFYLDEGHNFGIRFPHWAPHMGMTPHEHYEWIVSAVVANELTIFTYEVEVARKERRLKARSTFTGRAGRAGHIYDAGIHNPWNKTTAWSSSIHIYSLGDKPALVLEEPQVEGLPREIEIRLDVGSWAALERRAAVSAHAVDERLGNGADCLHDFLSQLMLRGNLELLATCRSSQVMSALHRAYVLGNLENRRRATEIVRPHDPGRAAIWDREIAPAERYLKDLARGAIGGQVTSDLP